MTIVSKIAQQTGDESGSQVFDDLTSDMTDVFDEVNRQETVFSAEHDNTTGKHTDVIADSLTLDGVTRSQWGTVVESGTCTAGSATTATLPSSIIAGADAYVGMMFKALSGAGAGRSEIIISHTTGAAPVLTMASGTAFDNTTVFEIYATSNQTIPQAVAASGPGDAAILQNLLPANFAEVWSNGTLTDIGTQVDVTDIAAGVCTTAATEGIEVDKLVRFNGGGSTGTNTYRVTAFVLDTSFTISDTSITDATAVSCDEVTPAITGAVSDGPDGLEKFGAADTAIYREFPGDDVAAGVMFGLKIVRSGSNGYVQWPHTLGKSELVHITRFNGKTVTLAATVVCDTANSARVMIQTSAGTTFSDYHSGGGAKEHLEVTVDVSSSNTAFACFWHQSLDGTAVFSATKLAYGSSIGEGNYTPPTSDWAALDNANVDIADSATPLAADDKVLDVELLSLGLPRGIKEIDLEIVTKDSAVADAAGIELGKDSTEQNLRCYPQVNNMSIAAAGIIHCDINGDIYQKITTAGNTLSATVYRVRAVRLRE